MCATGEEEFVGDEGQRVLLDEATLSSRRCLPMTRLRTGDKIGTGVSGDLNSLLVGLVASREPVFNGCGANMG